PSRRDDLEAVALLLIHVLTPGGLAWTRDGVPQTPAACDVVETKKRRASPEDLCRKLPEELEKLLKYCRSLAFADRPDYQHWIKAFRKLKKGAGYGDSDDFIWPPPKPVEKPPLRENQVIIRSPAVELDVMKDLLNELTRMRFDGPGKRRVLCHRPNVVEKAVVGGSGESKATRLARLTTSVSNATYNVALSGLVVQFIHTMKCTRQLTDGRRNYVKEPAHIKADVVARLRGEVGSARDTRVLALMLAEFIRVTNNSTAQTITQ
ncbi:hypothetical protein H0H92_013799, partial [Tricholoma furcatifolium]